MHFNIFTACRWLKEECFSKDSLIQPFKPIKYACDLRPPKLHGRMAKQGMEKVSEAWRKLVK